jgi:hypothetical protein
MVTEYSDAKAKPIAKPISPLNDGIARAVAREKVSADIAAAIRAEAEQKS